MSSTSSLFDFLCYIYNVYRHTGVECIATNSMYVIAVSSYSSLSDMARSSVHFRVSAHTCLICSYIHRTYSETLAYQVSRVALINIYSVYDSTQSINHPARVILPPTPSGISVCNMGKGLGSRLIRSVLKATKLY